MSNSNYPILDTRWNKCHVAPQRLFCRGTNSTYQNSMEKNSFQIQNECSVRTYNLCSTFRYKTTISLGFQTHIFGTIATPLRRFTEKRNIKYKTYGYIHKIWLYNLNLVQNEFSTVNCFAHCSIDNYTHFTEELIEWNCTFSIW